MDRKTLLRTVAAAPLALMLPSPPVPALPVLPMAPHVDFFGWHDVPGHMMKQCVYREQFTGLEETVEISYHEFHSLTPEARTSLVLERLDMAVGRLAERYRKAVS